MLWALDSAGIITLSEGMLLRQMGVKPGELVGRSVFNLYHDAPEITACARRALAGENTNTTMTVAGAVLDTWYSPLLDVDGRPIGTIDVALDVPNATGSGAVSSERRGWRQWANSPAASHTISTTC